MSRAIQTGCEFPEPHLSPNFSFKKASLKKAQCALHSDNLYFVRIHAEKDKSNTISIVSVVVSLAFELVSESVPKLAQGPPIASKYKLDFFGRLRREKRLVKIH